jgi:hypothetical protein
MIALQGDEKRSLMEFFYDLVYGVKGWTVELVAPAWGFGSVMTRAASSTLLAVVLFIIVSRYSDVSIPGLGTPSLENLRLLYSTEFLGSVLIAGLLVNYAIQQRNERLRDLGKAIEKALEILYKQAMPDGIIRGTSDENAKLRSQYREALSNLRRWPTGRRTWKTFQKLQDTSDYYYERCGFDDELRSALGEVSYLREGSLDRGLGLRYSWGQLLVVWVFLLCATAWSGVVAGNLPMAVSLLLTIFSLNVSIRLIDGQI